MCMVADNTYISVATCCKCAHWSEHIVLLEQPPRFLSIGWPRHTNPEGYLSKIHPASVHGCSPNAPANYPNAWLILCSKQTSDVLQSCNLRNAAILKGIAGQSDCQRSRIASMDVRQSSRESDTSAGYLAMSRHSRDSEVGVRGCNRPPVSYFQVCQQRKSRSSYMLSAVESHRNLAHHPDAGDTVDAERDWCAGRWELLHRGKRTPEGTSHHLLSSALQASGSSKHLQRLSMAPAWNQNTRLTSDEAPGENASAKYIRSQVSRGASIISPTPAFLRLKPMDPAAAQSPGWTSKNPGQVIGVRQDIGRRDSTPRMVARHFSR